MSNGVCVCRTPRKWHDYQVAALFPSKLNPEKAIGEYFADLPREVATVTLVAFCVALGFGIVVPVVPVFASSFGVSTFWASMVISVFALMRLVSASPAGWLINRVGERRVLWSGLGIVALSSGMAGLSQSFNQFLVLRGFGGIGSAMFTVSAMSILLRTVSPEQRGRATSTYQSGFLFGALAGPAVGGLVVGINIRAPFFLYAATLTLASCVAYFGLPLHDQVKRTDEESTTTVDLDSPITVQQALRIHAYWAALTVNLATGVALWGLRSSLLPLFVTSVLHKTLAFASSGFLLSGLTQAALLLRAGRMIDSRGRKLPLIIGTGTLALAMLMLMFDSSVFGFYLVMFLLGIGAAFLGPAPAAVVGDVVGKQGSGRVVALYQMTSDFGMIVGPLLAGYLTDKTGGFTLSFGMGLVIALVAVTMALTTTETRTEAITHPEGFVQDEISGTDK